MRAIALHQPYASAVALGLKRNETRHWPTKYRGPLAIFAAQRQTPDVCKVFLHFVENCDPRAYHRFDAECGCIFSQLPFGAYVATCQLTDCVPVETYLRKNKLTDRERMLGDYSNGRFVWTLDQIEQLNPPVPAKGRQGFWTWNK